ncbi:MAG: class II aldolase/adducin family protein, partial [Candidatus Eremiobacteraeota bacterium]|nr:class II aldolase/adducin family protein [Candidatus Eremiobacteraeota bacterium]
RLARLNEAGETVEGDPPTKEAALPLAMYRVRTDARAVVHMHAPHSVALSCLRHPDGGDVLPKLTPYAVMRVGALPLVPYAPPGDRALAEAVGRYAVDHHAVLLANHGPVVAGSSLDAAVATAEELEEVARLSFLLHGRLVRSLTNREVNTLRAAHRLR